MTGGLLAGLIRPRVSLKGSNRQRVEKELLLLRVRLPSPARRASLQDLSRPKVGTRQPQQREARLALVLGEVDLGVEI